MLNELLLRDPCMLRSSASSERLDWESNDENLGERFIFGSAVWLWMTFTDWNCGILGRAPVEFKELVVADFDGDCVDEWPLLLELWSKLPLICVLLWLWFIVLFEGVSRLRKCLNEKGFSFGGSATCLKSSKTKTKLCKKFSFGFPRNYLSSRCQQLSHWNVDFHRLPLSHLHSAHPDSCYRLPFKWYFKFLGYCT